MTVTKTKDRLRKLENHFDQSCYSEMTIRTYRHHPELRETTAWNTELDNCDIQLIQRALKRYRKSISKGDAE